MARGLSFRVLLVACFALALAVQAAVAAPFASMVMDARTGEVLQAENADTRLHPASLTKMMTLYIAFEAIKKGEIGLDTMVTVSAKAAGEAPSKLGLKKGQKIQMRYLIRAAAIKSANDAATAIGEAISGSEDAFAARMTRTARALGMKNTTFKNAHGLTQAGHLSTARDMTILGRHLIYDYPQYYNLFSRQSAHAGVGTVTSHNRLLKSYEGADGIKTGYTNAAGFNLVASAQRGNVRIIATVFGGTSTPARDAKVAQLLDLGFAKARKGGAVKTPPPPDYSVSEDVLVAAIQGSDEPVPGGAAKTLRVSGAALRSPRPHWRAAGAGAAAPAPEPVPAPPDALLAAIQDGVAEALEEAHAAPEPGVAVAAAVPVPPPRPGRAEEAPAGDAAQKLLEQPADDALLAALEAPADVPPAAGTDGTDAAAVAEAPSVDADPGVAMAGMSPIAALAAAAPPARPKAAAPAAPAGAEAAGAAPPADPAPADQPVAVAEALPQPDAPAAAPGLGAEVSGDTLVAFAPPPAADPEAAGGDELALLAEADEPPPGGLPVPLAEDDADSFSARRVPAPERPQVELASIEPEVFTDTPAEPEVVTRLSTSGGRHWGVSVGLYGSQYEAERVLLTTALKEVKTLGPALRKVARTPRGFQANFVGMTEDMAELACARLQARNVKCTTFGG